MKKFLAVSGGIDSMTMVHLAWVVGNGYAGFDPLFTIDELEVITVDHGTRPSSAVDAEFVKREVEARYEIKCHVIKVSLWEGVSEATARNARYKAIEKACESLTGGGKLGVDFEIWTAQHLEDLVESVAINILRGTGWRGLAVMRRPGVRRPLIEGGYLLMPAAVSRSMIYELADQSKIKWRIDPSNNESKYLRNRIREDIYALDLPDKYKIYSLWEKQCNLANEIDGAVTEILELAKNEAGEILLPREWFYGMDDAVADEILRAWLLSCRVSTTRPQRADLLRAIRRYRAGKKFNLPHDKMVKIGKNIQFL